MENIKELLENENFTFIEHDICEPLRITQKLDQFIILLVQLLLLLTKENML